MIFFGTLRFSNTVQTTHQWKDYVFSLMHKSQSLMTPGSDLSGLVKQRSAAVADDDRCAAALKVHHVVMGQSVRAGAAQTGQRGWTLVSVVSVQDQTRRSSADGGEVIAHAAVLRFNLLLGLPRVKRMDFIAAIARVARIAWRSVVPMSCQETITSLVNI